MEDKEIYIRNFLDFSQKTLVSSSRLIGTGDKEELMRHFFRLVELNKQIESHINSLQHYGIDYTLL